MNLLEINDGSIVSKTNLSRKLTIGGITKAYPVYSVRLDQLFYNDQNDRIATWITQYKNDTKNASFSSLDREEYNKTIERFIIESNPSAIEKTKNNIALVNQREPGVVLTDGRIIDGNRRFTCLRLLHEEDASFNYFETVILDADAEADQKQIKMLELAIQHGEEQRVDYNQIDMAIGAYHDIVETELLTIEEYASSTNESVNEVKKRLSIAELIIEFLEFMNVPKQYHIAREMQVYSVFSELLPLLKRCDTEEGKTELKECVFNNLMMGSFTDQRKFIRSIKSMMDSGLYSSYMKKQKSISEEIDLLKEDAQISNKAELDAFIKDNEELSEDLQISMDRALLKSKKAQSRSKPSQIVNKSISMLMDIDTRIIDKLSSEEKEKLSKQIHKLNDAVSIIEEEVLDEGFSTKAEEPEEVIVTPKRPFVAQRHANEPIVYCTNENYVISNLAFSLEFSAIKSSDVQDDSAEYYAYFVDESNEELCPLQEISINTNEASRVNFSLNSSASGLDDCYLVLKSKQDSINEAQQIIKFKINISFTLDFDF